MSSQGQIRRKPVPNGYELHQFGSPASTFSGFVSDRTVSAHAMETKLLYDADVRSIESVGHRNYWTPYYLTRPVLITFGVIYFSLLVTLGALFGYSQHNQGLSTANDRYFYLWLYGPTAVFIVISTFWDQVVYRIKQLTPWLAMGKEFQPAKKSLLLDYISPMSLAALFRAFRNSHYPAAVALLSNLVFTAMVISSTGLFSPQYAYITRHDRPVTVTTEFNLSNFDWSSIDSRPAVLAYSANRLGLNYPPGTNKQYAVQTFDDPHGPNSTLAATVDAFSAWLECEPADLQLVNATNTTNTLEPFVFAFHINSSTCTLSDFTMPGVFQLDGFKTQNYTGEYGWGIGSWDRCLETDQPRIFVTAGYLYVDVHIVLVQDALGFTNFTSLQAQSTEQTFRITNSTNMICTPRYRIAQSRVTKISQTNQRVELNTVDPINEGSENNSTTADIMLGVFQSFTDPGSRNFYDTYVPEARPRLTSMYFAQILASFPSFDHEWLGNHVWLQYDQLKEASNSVFSSIAAQIAAQKLLDPTNNKTLGNETANELRLFVRVLSFVLLELCLVILLSITIYFVLSATSSTMLYRDPGSLSGLADTLGISPELNRMLNGWGNTSKAQIDNLVQQQEYILRVSDAGTVCQPRDASIKLQAMNDKTHSELPTRDSTKISWWQPFPLRLAPSIVAVIIPLMFVILLEGLLRLSQSLNGLVGIQTSSWLHYGWTYIPALFMVCVHTIYHSINFNVQVLAPYTAMKKGSASASTSVEDHPLSRIAIQQMISSISLSKVALFTATIATLLAPLLTITVSGLYTVDNFNQTATTRPLTGWQYEDMSLDDWDLDLDLLADLFHRLGEPNVSGPDLDFTEMDAILAANLSFPKRAYDEVALPVFEVTTINEKYLPTASKPPAGLLQASIPAVRAGLNCTVVPQDHVIITYATYDDAFNSSRYLSPVTTWFGSWQRPFQGNRACKNWTAAYPEPVAQKIVNGCHMAIFSVDDEYSLNGCKVSPQIVLQPLKAVSSQTFGFFSSLTDPTYPHCPLLGGMIGTLTSEKIEDYTWFLCSTYMESVMTKTEFRLPDYEIDSVVLDEATAVQIPGNATWQRTTANHETELVVFQGANAALNFQGPTAIDGNGMLSFYNYTDGQNYDNFFGALVYGRYGVPAAQMLGEANIPRLLSAVTHLWKVIYAVSFPNMASALPRHIQAEQARGDWTATFRDPTTYRLQQHALPTRILQGILAALSLCGLITFVFMDTRRVLPNNPCSIAVMMSLLAGSEMLDVVGNGKKGGVPEEDKRSGHSRSRSSDSLQGYFFSLGWWNRSNGTWRYGIDVGKADKSN